ncbi:hypothetical protein YSY22_06720 [Brevibacillus formosus]
MASKGWEKQNRQERFDNKVESQGVSYSETHWWGGVSTKPCMLGCRMECPSFHSANLLFL